MTGEMEDGVEGMIYDHVVLALDLLRLLLATLHTMTTHRRASAVASGAVGAKK